MSDFTKTKAELATAVLHEMVVIDATETEADHATSSAHIQDAYDMIYDRLVEQEYAYWALAAIPTSVFFAIRDLVINEISGAFGQPKSSAQKEQDEQIILKRIRRHVRSESSNVTPHAQYF